jgi:type II secretory pathway pseudopilin PulG
MKRKHSEDGFTIIEVLVVGPIFIVTCAIFLGFMLSLYVGLNTKAVRLGLKVDSQSALNEIHDDLYYALSFTASPSNSDANAPSGGWNASSQANTFVVNEVALDKNREQSTRQIVYIANTPYTCDDTFVYQNDYSINNVIYFVSGGNLYRRTLIPDQTNNCTTTFRKTTCPSAASSSACPTDTLIAENVKSLVVAYYDLGNNALTNSADDIARADRIQLTLTLEKLSSGDPVTEIAMITIKRING